MSSKVQEGLAGKSQEARPVYVIFEGGGAKGITHIGALKALESAGLLAACVAGTSAGAIVASLVAVGYNADDLFRGDGSTDVLREKKSSPLDLLGRGSWFRYRFLRLTIVPLALLVAVAALGAHWRWGPFALIGATAFLALIPLVAGRAKLRLVLPKLMLLALLAGVWALLIAVAPGDLVASVSLWIAVGALILVLVLLWPVIWRRGLFSTVAMERLLNDLLRSKLCAHYQAMGWDEALVPKKVRFCDIAPENVPQCIPLKVVVTDVRSGGLILFDQHTEQVVIAEAVAASAAIPFVFRSPVVHNVPLDWPPMLVDGGLISNLPAWSFRAEKRALERRQGGPPVPIIAFTLSGGVDQAEAQDRPLGLTSFVVAVLQAGIFGSQKIVQEFVSDLVVVDLPSPLKTLAFNCKRWEAASAYRAGLECAATILAKQRKIAEGTGRALERVLADIETEIAQRRSQAGRQMPRLRICLVDPVGKRANAFRVVASARMEQDPDDQLELDWQNDIAPHAFRTRTEHFAQLSGRTARELYMTKYEHALVAKGVESVICFPVSAPRVPGAPPERVVCIDSSDSLQGDFNDPTFRTFVRGRSAVFSRSLIEQAAEADDGTQSSL